MASLGLLVALACGGGGGNGAKPSPEPTPEPTNKVTLILPPPASGTGGSYWVACQDGQGAWKVLTGVPSGPTTTTYSFLVGDLSGRYGLAVVDIYPLGGGAYGYYGMLEHFTLSEVRTLDYSTLGPVSTASVSGTVSGLTSADGARIATGSYTKTLNPGVTGSLLSAAVGNADFLAARLPGMGPADALVVRRGYPVPASGGTSVGFHFPDGWALVPQTCTVTGLTLSESLTLSAEWRTPTTPIKLAEATASPMAFNAVPSNYMQSGDLHVLTATAKDSTALTYRYAMAYRLSASGLNLSLPQACPVPTFGAGSGSAYYRPTLSWTTLEGAQVHDLLIGDAYELLDWSIHFSKGWLGVFTSPSYTFPDFSSLSGWSSAWGLPFGRDLYWNFSQRQTTHADPGFFFDGPRSFLADHSAWESMRYGGVNVVGPSAFAQPRVWRPELRPRKASGIVSSLRFRTPD
jgi:hypothetical protein